MNGAGDSEICLKWFMAATKCSVSSFTNRDQLEFVRRNIFRFLPDIIFNCSVLLQRTEMDGGKEIWVRKGGESRQEVVLPDLG